MNLLLIILKYAGTAISGAAGIWGTVSETRDQKTGKLSRWGKWALGLAIGGFVVALSSQIVEQVLDDRDQLVKELEHKQVVSDLKEQLALAKGIASTVEGEKTRFETITVSPQFDLPMTDQRVKELADELERLVPPQKKRPRHLPSTFAWHYRFRKKPVHPSRPDSAWFSAQSPTPHG